MNNIFQDYKLGLITVDSEGIVESKVFIPDFEDVIEIPVHTINKKEKYNRAKEMEKARKKVESEYLNWEDERNE